MYGATAGAATKGAAIPLQLRATYCELVAVTTAGAAATNGAAANGAEQANGATSPGFAEAVAAMTANTI